MLRGKSFNIPGKWIRLGAVAFCIFILGGGVYSILLNPQSMVRYGMSWISIHYRSDEQTLNESVIALITNLLMFLGFYIAHKGTEVAYDRSKANRFMTIGIGLILAGLAGNYYIIGVKNSLGG